MILKSYRENFFSVGCICSPTTGSGKTLCFHLLITSLKVMTPLLL